MNLRLSARTWRWLFAYALAIAGIFGLVGWYLATHDEALRDAVLRFLLPDDLLFVGDALLEKFISPQQVAVLINALVTGSVVLVSMLTFPLKEWLSASYESDTQVTSGRPIHPPPLREQALEEIKLVIFYAAMTLLVLRIGHDADQTTKIIALGLSHLVLFVTVALDFASPTLARHRIRYADIARVLASRPIRSLGFGAMFGLPPVLAGWASVKLQLPPTQIFVIVGVVNLMSIVGAVLVGTIVGGTLLDRAEQARPLGAPVRLGGWVLMLALLGINGAFFGAAGQALYHVSPVLKLDWSLVPDTFDVDPPGLLDPSLGIELKLRIHNPTERTARVGENTVEVLYEGKRIAESGIPPFEVEPGQTSEQPVKFVVKAGRDLLDVGLKGAASMWNNGVMNTLSGMADQKKYRVDLVLPTPSGPFRLALFDPKNAKKKPAK